MKRRKWTPREDGELREGYLKGEAISALASRFGTTPGNLWVRLHRLGVKRPPALHPQGKAPRRPAEAGDIATRLAVLLGLEPRQEATRREFTDAQLLRFVGQGTPPEVFQGLKERAWAWIEGLNRNAPSAALGSLARYAVVESPPPPLTSTCSLLDFGLPQ